MKVYAPNDNQNKAPFRIHCTPGTEVDNVSEFKNPNGSPKKFTVEFIRGVAEVIDPLGKWLIDKTHALKAKRKIRLPGEDD